MTQPLPPDPPKLWTRRSLLLALAGAGLAVPACEIGQLFSWNGGKPIIFGYSTAPNFDKRYKTIKVKIFKDSTFWAVVPVPGLEMQLTETLVHQIEQITPYKVNDREPDLELSGRIVDFQQIALNYNQLNEVREYEVTMTCAIKLKDMRTGRLISSPSPRNIEPPPPAGILPGMQDPLLATMPGGLLQMPFNAAPVSPSNTQATLSDDPSQTSDTNNPSLGQNNASGAMGGPPVAPLPTGGFHGGVLVRSIAHYRVEIGQSLATAQQDACAKMAEQIVNMMEKPW